jgi:nicotinate-nucleotide pyrophosphorylase (carboxylating)
MFNPSETLACQKLVELALAEDLEPGGDYTSLAIVPPELTGLADFVARSAGILAGLPTVELVINAVDPRLTFDTLIPDGASLRTDDRIGHVRGPLHGLFATERIALNFLQHLSGIATLTRRFVEAVAGLPCSIYDTRKTTPGWRLLEKYAVRQGGGGNHRMGLNDGVLIKDNHLVALRQSNKDLATIVAAARAQYGDDITVEVDTLELLDEALTCKFYLPELVLLDNMSLDEMREAVRRRNRVAPDVYLEASGGITLANVRAIAETGVDRISVGALTHSAPALDIALDYVTG